MGGDWFGGIDVGARRLHVAALDAAGMAQRVETFPSEDLAGVARWAAGAAGIGIDAPDAWSTAPHANDDRLPPKFRTARCGEIALGREHGIWVPWTTPTEPRPGTWIDVGVRLFAALRAGGHHPVEVYPHGAFRVLNLGRPPARKSTPTGRAQRAALLAAAGLTGVPKEASHDVLDAIVAALVARQQRGGRARAATCGHDGSAIWLPALLQRPL